LSERPETPGDDPLDGRLPTSHERMSGRPWDASYVDGSPPWDVGVPQPAIERVVLGQGLVGPVLDAGCGTGENTLLIASQGLEVLGVDVAESALAIAREKAQERGLAAEFAAADALQLERLGRTFATIIDSGLFHSFDGDERGRYAASLASVTAQGGTAYVLCFSNVGPDIGPHPVSPEALRSAFSAGSGWSVVDIETDRVLTTFNDEYGAPAWLATIKRL
jgi:SAM-dependent methyltransferase